MPPFEKVLSPNAQNALKSLSYLDLASFYLAGGTALALQLEHRVSVDFDFFSEKTTLDLAERETITSTLSAHGIAFEIEKDKDRTLILQMNGTRISFFHYPYPLIEPLIKLLPLSLASICDIGVMKLSAVIGRGARRDFIDLYQILQTIPLQSLLEKASKKYDKVTDFPFQALKALTYFEEAETDPMPKLLKPVEWKNVRHFLEEQANALTRQWLK